MMWSERIGNELYVYHNGSLVYKRWYKPSGHKAQPSRIFNINGWPGEWIY